MLVGTPPGTYVAMTPGSFLAAGEIAQQEVSTQYFGPRRKRPAIAAPCKRGCDSAQLTVAAAHA